MRGLIALCMGLGVMTGAVHAANAGLVGGECCICRCVAATGDDDDDEDAELEFAACLQIPDRGGDPSAACDTICGEREFDLECSFEPTPCFTFSSACASTRAPAASPYGIAAVLIALGGFGAWRLRKRHA